MISFVTLETRDHTQVSEFFLLLGGLPSLSCVNSDGRGRAFSLSFVLFLLLVFLFLLEGSEFWVEVGTEVLVLDLSSQ